MLSLDSLKTHLIHGAIHGKIGADAGKLVLLELSSVPSPIRKGVNSQMILALVGPHALKHIAAPVRIPPEPAPLAVGPLPVVPVAVEIRRCALPVHHPVPPLPDIRVALLRPRRCSLSKRPPIAQLPSVLPLPGDLRRARGRGPGDRGGAAGGLAVVGLARVWA
eukprot:3618499-Rhodomonas_salina.3